LADRNLFSLVRAPKRFQSPQMQPRIGRSRPYRIFNAGFHPATNTTTWNKTTGALHLNAVGSGTFVAPVILTELTKVYGLSIRGTRLNVGDGCTCSFKSITDAGVIATIATATVAAGAGFQTVSSPNFSHIIQKALSYYVECELVAAASANNANLLWAELQRTQPNVETPY
jgi:hypothetical protein